MSTTRHSLENMALFNLKEITQNRKPTPSSKAKKENRYIHEQNPKIIWIQNLFGCSSPVKTKIKTSSGSERLLWVVSEENSLDSSVSNVDTSEPSPNDDVYSADNLPGETAEVASYRGASVVVMGEDHLTGREVTNVCVVAVVKGIRDYGMTGWPTGGGWVK